MSPTMNVFDRVLKVLARNYPERFLQLAVPATPAQLIGTLENVDLAIPEERVDFVHRLDDEGQEKLLHIEFQTGHRSDVPERVFIYAALLTRQFRLPVITLVVYLAPRRSSPPTAYEVRLGDAVMNRFEYSAVCLWEHVAEIQTGRWPELAPLLVMLVDRPDEQVLAQERMLILQEQDRRKRADLLACAVTIGARFFDKTFLWRFFREEVEMMREATFIEDWLEEELQRGREQGLQQGLQQGEERGERRASHTILRRILWRRFGTLPLDLDKRLEGLTAAQAEVLVDVALDAPDLTTFQTALAGMSLAAQPVAP